jgi:hypothetical protein
VKKNLPGRALFATTISNQKKEIKALKKLKFKRVGSWRNGNTGRVVTMWCFNPGMKKVKRDESAW